MKKYISSILVMMCLLNFISIAGAAQNSNTKQEQKAAWEEAEKAKIVGPTQISLLDQAQITIPAHYEFIPQPQASRVMKSMGNGDCTEMVGFIISDKDNEEWILTIDYTKSGYIKDDEAKNWNADELLPPHYQYLFFNLSYIPINFTSPLYFNTTLVTTHFSS